MSPTPTRRRAGRSRLGGVPTVLPVGEPNGQLPLPLSGEGSPTRRELLPGVVHIARWLEPDERQPALVVDFKRWARPPAGLRHPRVPAGHVMTVQSVCLGWHWYPYAYSRTADDTDGAPVKPMPDHVAALARRAVDAAYGRGSGTGFAPDAAIVNLYAPGARLGLHQDGDEPVDAPVVTISLGDTCVFRMAGVDRRTAPFTDVLLASGDLLVFGGPNRLIHHGVPKVLAGTAPPGVGLPPGRLSITVRDGVAVITTDSVLEQLDERGYARAGVLLDDDEISSLAAAFDDDACYRSRISMGRYRYGEGDYAYFAQPLPPPVQRLHESLYPPLAAVANRWARRAGRRSSWPDDLDGLLARCRRHGQVRPTPLILRYRTGGYNTLHQDRYGEVAFPLQVVIGLSAPDVEYTGGEFLLTEQRPRAQTRATAIRLERGEGVVFPNDRRPVEGRRGVHHVTHRHGASEVRSGVRLALGIIFHDAC